MKNLLNKLNKKNEWYSRRQEWNTRISVGLATALLAFVLVIATAVYVPKDHVLRTPIVTVLFLLIVIGILTPSFFGYRTLYFAESFTEEKAGVKIRRYKIFIYKKRWTPFTPKPELITFDTLDDVDDYYESWVEDPSLSKYLSEE